MYVEDGNSATQLHSAALGPAYPDHPVHDLPHETSTAEQDTFDSTTSPNEQIQSQFEQPKPEQASHDGSPQTSVMSLDGDYLANTSGLVSPFTEPDGGDQKVAMLATVGTNLGEAVSDLYAENILAKIYRTATKSLVGEHRFPDYFPEYVPQDGGHAGSYVLREAEFWTCGFFPGSLHSLWERAIRFPRSIRIPGGAASREDDICIEDIRLQLQGLCNIWSRPLHAMASRTDTHDIGFIVMPALKLDWELTGNQHSLNSIIRAARSLATRYVPTAGAIRSWDLLLKKNLEITDQTENMILIIDSMCNLDLLYYAAEHCRDGQELYDIATSHATVLLRSHLREEKPQPLSQDCYAGPWYSTCHVANIDPRTGDLKARLTHQGYANESTWARGQAWGIMGYAQTYMSTKTETFLQAACGLAEYFIYRLETAPDFVNEGGRYVPLWDFDAPIEDRSSPLRDSSAGSIAANGMLILSQALAAAGETKLSARYLRMAVKLVRELLEFAQAPEKARLVTGSSYAIQVEDTTPTGFDGILKFGTANNNQYSKKRYANHGLVYGDYYLVEFGNRLLRMGLV